MWATPDDVLAVTGQGADISDIAPANSVIEIYANRSQSASSSMGARDIASLRMAVCWQTVWQRDQPGYESRSVAANYSQDGMGVQHNADWNIALAPLAARALKNLSWKASRTIRTPSAALPTGLGAALDFTNERSDRFTDWQA